MASEFTERRAVWLYQHYRWLERNLPSGESTGRRRVILATKEFFPDRYARDHASAECVFLRVRELMGILDWPCRLHRVEDGDREFHSQMARGGVLGESSIKGAAGTFSVPSPDEVVITYSASLLNDPIGMVATFAHELCHYLLATVSEEPPGTWSELEPLTDLSAVIEGFGVFLCNSAFQFNQWTSNDQQGWSFQRKGYLSEEELGFSLAVYCVRNGIGPDSVAAALKPNPRDVFLDALDFVSDLERTNELT